MNRSRMVVLSRDWTLSGCSSRLYPAVFWRCWLFLHPRPLLEDCSTFSLSESKMNLFEFPERRLWVCCLFQISWKPCFLLIRVLRWKLGDRVDLSYEWKCFQSSIMSPRDLLNTRVGRSSFLRTSVCWDGLVRTQAYFPFLIFLADRCSKTFRTLLFVGRFQLETLVLGLKPSVLVFLTETPYK